MNTTNLMGNAHIKAQLAGPLAHAYLISGEETAQRRILADLMARSLICEAADRARPCGVCPPCEKAARGIHPDIQVRGPIEGKTEIPVAAVREMVAEAPILPNEADRKVYIIESADSLNPSAQNAFLKLLEEPPSFVTFLLLAENPLALLPTVRSRCVHLSLTPDAGDSALDIPPEEIAELVNNLQTALRQGGLPLLQFCVSLEKLERAHLTAFIETTHRTLVRSLAQTKTDRAQLIKAIDLFDSLRTDLRFNVSAGHISGKILATLI
ncbi:MAG: hypothetical protein FWE12_05550 [Oscillospiraceae bacterium]|nr:hypothetical protein [Oscillospiraceae bacterium]